MATKNNIIGQFRVDDETLEKINRHRFGDKLTVTVERLLRERLAMDDDANAPDVPEIKSASDILRERKLEAEVADRERRNAEAMRELISQDDALARLEKDYSQVRQRIQQISLDGLTDDQRDQLEKAKQDCMTDLSGDSNATGNL